MTPPPVPSFLTLKGSPDTRPPTPRQPESQLPPIPHMPGSPGTLKTYPHVEAFLSLPEEAQKVYPEPVHEEISDKDQRDMSMFMGVDNYPKAQNGAGAIFNAIDTLAQANIRVSLPGEFVPTPHLEMDPDYLTLEPELQTFIRVLEKSGTFSKASIISGVPRSCAYKLRETNEKFNLLCERSLLYRAEMIEDEAIRRAVSGVSKDIYYKGDICGREKVYSDTLLVKLLEGNMPERYRQNHKIELDAKMAVATLVMPATTTAEEWVAQNSGLIIDQAPEDEYATK